MDSTTTTETVKTNDTDGIAFGKIPLAVIAAGALVGLSHSCMAVYLVIAAHVNGTSWRAWPTIETIVQQTGFTRRAVQLAINRLADRGLITIDRGGGKHKSNIYVVVTFPDHKGRTLECAVSQPIRRNLECAVSKQSGGDTAQNPTPYSAKSDPIQRTLECAPTAEQQNSSRPGAAGAAAAAGQKSEAADLLRELRAAGVGNPVLTELAGTAGVTADLVRTQAARLDGTGKGTGILIENIRTAAAQALVEADVTARSAADAKINEQQRRGKVSKRDLAVREAFAVVKGLSVERRATVLADVLSHVGHFKRTGWAKADPLTHEGLALAMANTASKAVTP